MNQELMKLQLDERIRPLGPWTEDTALYHCVHTIQSTGNLNSYVIVSLPEHDIQKIIELAIEAGMRIEKCVPHVASIAALMGRLTKEPVMACIFNNTYLEILVAQKGIPYYSQISPLDDELFDVELIHQAILHVRQIIDSKFNKTVKKTLFFNAKDIPLPDHFLKEEVWRPNLDNFVKGAKADVVWKFPELIGAAFVSKDFDCLSPELKSSYLIRDINKAAVSLALGGLIILGATGNYLSVQKDKVQVKYEQLTTTIKKRKEEVLAKLPEKEEIKNFKQIVRVINEVAKEPSLDTLLYSIAASVPEKVIIDQLHVKRSEIQQTDTKEEIPPPEAFSGENISPDLNQQETNNFFQRPLVVTLKFLTKGDFQQVKTRLEKTVDLLGNKFQVDHIRIEYKEETGEGHLACQFEISGERG